MLVWSSKQASKQAHPLGPRFASPRQGLAGGRTPSDPRDGNGARTYLGLPSLQRPLPTPCFQSLQTIAFALRVAADHA